MTDRITALTELLAMQRQIDDLTTELANLIQQTEFLTAHLTNAANRTDELINLFSAEGTSGGQDSSVH